MDFFDDYKAVLKRAKNEGVGSVFSCSTDFSSMKKHAEFFLPLKEVKVALGIHPVDLLKMSDLQIKEGMAFLREKAPNASAIGEIGLDYKYGKKKSERDLQEKYFTEQVEIELENNFPIVVHCRYSEEKTFQLLELLGAKKVLLHWFTNSIDFVKMASKKNYFMSAGPSIFSQESAQKVAKEIPLDLLLLETDAPVSFDGMQSEPSWIPKVAQKIGQLKELSLTEVSKATEKNYEKLF